jgi:hypothetical protein
MAARSAAAALFENLFGMPLNFPTAPRPTLQSLDLFGETTGSRRVFVFQAEMFEDQIDLGL